MTDLFGATHTTFSGSPAAYAAPPGSGPAGMTCADCANSTIPARANPRARFWKCRLVRTTFGPGTDIRARTPACSKFTPMAPEGGA